MTRIVTLGDSITLGMGDPAQRRLARLGTPPRRRAARPGTAQPRGARRAGQARRARPAAGRAAAAAATSPASSSASTTRCGPASTRCGTGQAAARTVAALHRERRHRADHAAARPGADVRAARRARPAAVAADARGQRRARQGRRPLRDPALGRLDRPGDLRPAQLVGGPAAPQRARAPADRLPVLGLGSPPPGTPVDRQARRRADRARRRPAATTSCGWRPRAPSGSCAARSTSFLTCCSWRRAKR